MSNNLKCTCVIPGCILYGKKIYAEFSSLKKHITQKHGHQDLVNFAYDEEIIKSKSGYISHTWLVEEIAKLCLLINSQ